MILKFVLYNAVDMSILKTVTLVALSLKKEKKYKSKCRMVYFAKRKNEGDA